MNNRLNNLLALVRESSNTQVLNENFGKLSPLMQRIGPLTKAFTQALKSGGKLGQNSEFETTEKITYANLLRLLTGDIKLSNGSNLNGAVVMINGKPALSLAYGRVPGRMNQTHSAIYMAYNRKMFIDAVYGDIKLPADGTVPSEELLSASSALEAYNNSTTAGMMTTRGPVIVRRLPLNGGLTVVHGTGGGQRTVSVTTFNTATGGVQGQKRAVSFIQNMIKLHSKMAEAIDPRHKVKFSIVGIGADEKRVAAVADRQVAKAGTVPVPSDKSYKEYIKNLSYAFKKKVETFKMDKLVPTLKSLSIEDFKDPRKLGNAIRDSKIFEDQMVKIGQFTYKLEKLETTHSWEERELKVPHGTIVQTLEFKYRMIDSDVEARRKMRKDAFEPYNGTLNPARDIDIEAAAERIPPTEYSGQAFVFINLLNLSDTRIQVNKVTSYNW